MDPEGSFSCNFCDRFFTLKKHLKRHITNKHSIQCNEISNVDSIECLLNVECVEDNEQMDTEELTYTENNINVPSSTHDMETESLISDNSERNYDVLKFVLKYISKPEMPRSFVIEMIKDFSEILRKLMDSENIENVLSALPVTEYKIESVLKSMKIFIECKTICIHKYSEPYINSFNVPELRTIEHVVKIFPLLDLFSILFKETNFFEIIFKYFKSLSVVETNNKIESICQSSFFQDVLKQVKEKFPLDSDNVLNLPISVYIDDFEPNNPLGSRSSYKKISGIYCKINCLPPIHQSKLYNTFKIGYFHSEDRKKLSNSRVLKPLTDELNNLCENLIQVNNSDYSNVRLIPCTLQGDNLALNQCLEGSEGFNTDKACRFCYLCRDSFEYFFACPENSLYNKEKYYEMVAQPNCCFKSETILNELHFFHAADNPMVDPAHDLLEGVCKYDMTLILHILIKKEKSFTVEYLNQRILSVYFDSSNSPPLLDPDFEKRGLRMSASEIRTFIKIFSFLVGDKIDPNSEAWYLFILMTHIVSISFSYFIYKDETPYLLESLICIHNKLYSKLFKIHLLSPLKADRQFYLPFKFHVITHYPFIMKRVGPLGHCQNLRFESGHQAPKKTSAASKCKINILETITKKESFNYSYLILNFSEISNINMKTGTKLILSEDEKENIKKIFNFKTLQNFDCLTKIEYNEKVIEPGMVLKIDGYGKECIFYLIKNIILYENNAYFAFQKLETIQFNDFLFCFEIKEIDEFELILIDECDLQYCTYIYVKDSKKYLYFNDYFYFEN